MNNNTDKTKQGTAQKDVVDKVASGERASFGDAPLTPSKKMQAEEKNMKKGANGTEERHEVDKQQASLGDKVLTPQQKADRAQMESQQKNPSAKSAEAKQKNKH